MELVGAAVRKKNLSGNENLSDLVGKFIDTRALPLKGEMMPAIERHFRQELDQKRTNAKKTLTSLAINSFLPIEKDQRESAVDGAIGEYFRATFGTYYDRLSNDMFDLERREEFVVDEEKAKVDIPLFASVSVIYPSNDWSFKKEVRLAKKDDYGFNKEVKHEIIVSSPVPPLSNKARRDSLLARSRYMRICADAYADSVLGVIFSEQVGHARIGRGKDICLDLDVCWIPSSKDLKLTLGKTTIIDRDPILVGTIWGDSYLISKWDVKGEIPYEHYLAEFTEQKAGNK